LESRWKTYCPCNYNGWYDSWYATRHLAIAASTGGETEVLTKTLDRNVSKPKFSKDGNIFLVEESGTSILASVNTDGKNLERVIKEILVLMITILMKEVLLF
jgi:hypothetical protein